MDKHMMKFLALSLLFVAVNSVIRPSFVTRNVQDVFRYDDYSCLQDERVCTRRNAICLSDGSCLCRNNTPDYVNPQYSVNYGYLSIGTRDSCMSFEPVIDSIDLYNLGCSYSFHPFHLMASTPQEEAMMFIHSAGSHYSSCSVTNAIAKYPTVKEWKRISWLNQSHIDINMTYVGVLLFRWNKSVNQLQGLIVVVNLNCSRILLNQKYRNQTYSEQCLRMKIEGNMTFSSSMTSRNRFSVLVVFISLGAVLTLLQTETDLESNV